jgi:hypothetical protein
MAKWAGNSGIELRLLFIKSRDFKMTVVIDATPVLQLVRTRPGQLMR